MRTLAVNFLLYALLAAPTASAATLKTLFTFPATNVAPFHPAGGLTLANGLLYGTTYEGGSGGRGTLYSVDPGNAAANVVVNFSGTNGALPAGNLTPLNGLLYGTTTAGGPAGAGTIFQFNPASGTLTSLASFNRINGLAPAGSLTVVGGKLFGVTTFGGKGSQGTVFAFDPVAKTITTLLDFNGGVIGGQPLCGMVAIGNQLYGTTQYGGGTSGKGTLFRINAVTGAHTTLHVFGAGLDGAQPIGSLAVKSGMVYGATTGQTGPLQSPRTGTIFKYDPATKTESLVRVFLLFDNLLDAPQAGVTIAGDTLYAPASYGGGTSNANGGIAVVNLTTGLPGTDIDISGLPTGTPVATVTVAGGTIYGVTGGQTSFNPAIRNAPKGGGTVFSVAPSSATATELVSFNGSTPAQNAISGLTVNSTTLIGTATINNAGRVFSLPMTNPARTRLTNFPPNTVTYGGLTNANGAWFGTFGYGANGNGGIFTFTPATASIMIAYAYPTSFFPEGGPTSGLVYVNKMLYGTNANDINAAYGTIFQVDPGSPTPADLYTFTGSSDGGLPMANLLEYGGLIYGTSTVSLNYFLTGTVFSFAPSSTTLTTLHSFTGTSRMPTPEDGANPVAGVTPLGANFYGVTQFGGVFTGGCVGIGCGAVYSLPVSGGADSVLHSFTGGGDGAYPLATLLAVGNTLYGSTSTGGTHNAGTLFSINPATGALTTLYSFTGTRDGASPAAGLIAVGGALYGTTNAGGPANAGTVFQLTP